MLLTRANIYDNDYCISQFGDAGNILKYCPILYVMYTIIMLGRDSNRIDGISMLPYRLLVDIVGYDVQQLVLMVVAGSSL